MTANILYGDAFPPGVAGTFAREVSTQVEAEGDRTGRRSPRRIDAGVGGRVGKAGRWELFAGKGGRREMAASCAGHFFLPRDNM